MWVEVRSVVHYEPGSLVTGDEVQNFYNQEWDSAGVRHFSSDMASKAAGVGIKTRFRWDESSKDIMIKTGIKLIETLTPDERERVSLIVGTGLFPSKNFPATAAYVAQALSNYGVKGAEAVDMTTGCTGFLKILQYADKLLEPGKIGLVIAAENQSNALMPVSTIKYKKENNIFMSDSEGEYMSDYKAGMLVGNAGAWVTVQHTAPETWIQGIQTFTDASLVDLVYANTQLGTRNPDVRFAMEGLSVYKEGIKATVDQLEQYFSHKGLSPNNFDHVIMHQSNKKMILEIAKKAHIDEAKLLTSIETHGNTGTASIPLTLSIHADKIKRGERLLLVAFGAGFSVVIIDMIRNQDSQPNVFTA